MAGLIAKGSLPVVHGWTTLPTFGLVFCLPECPVGCHWDTPDCSPSEPGSCQVRKVRPDQKVVLWDGQAHPEATLRCPILSHLLPPARV